MIGMVRTIALLLVLRKMSVWACVACFLLFYKEKLMIG